MSNTKLQPKWRQKTTKEAPVIEKKEPITYIITDTSTDLFNNYKVACAHNSEIGIAEVEYVLHVEKDTLKEIINGSLKDYGYIPKGHLRNIKEIRCNQNNGSKLVARNIESNGETKTEIYIKTRLISSKLKNNFNCNQSIETYVINNSKGENVIPSMFIETPEVVENQIWGLEVDGILLECIQTLKSNNDRIEFECTPDMSLETWNYVKQKLYFISDYIESDVIDDEVKQIPNIQRFVRHFCLLLDIQYNNIRTLKTFIVQPISYTRAVNLKTTPGELLGTPKLDGALCVISTIASGWAIISLDLGSAKTTPDIIEKHKGLNNLLVFGEYLEKSNTIYLFDIIYWKEKPLYKMININRFKPLPDVVDYINSIEWETDMNLTIKHKEFYDMENKDNFELIHNYTDEPTDGMILYKKHNKYENGTIYKFKPAELNTIDLYLYKNNDTIYLCVAKYKTQKLKWKQADALKYAKILKGKLSLYQLSIPNYDDIGITDINNCLFENSEIENTVKQSTRGGFVVEVVWMADEGKWKFIRLRPDKTQPNMYETALDNFLLSIAPISSREFYSKNNSFYRYKDSARFNKINAYMSHCMNFYIRWFYAKTDQGSYATNVPVFNKFADVMCGRGGRLPVIDSLNIKKEIYFWDTDISSLETLKERMYRFKKKVKFDPDAKCLEKVIKYVKEIDVTNIDLVKKELEWFIQQNIAGEEMRQEEYIDALSIMYSIHYAFKSYNAFMAFANLINGITRPGSLLITNIIDAEIAMNLSPMKVYSMKPKNDNYDFSTIYNNMFLTSIPFVNEVTGNVEIIEEPALNSQALQKAMLNIGWELVNKTPIGYMPNNPQVKANIDVYLTDAEDKEWVKAHVLFCFRKL